MSDGRTHWEGCWRDHHDCAVAEVERLRADAERYRWLRDGPSSGQWSYLEGCCEDALDEAVDKMRASSPTEGSRE